MKKKIVIITLTLIIFQTIYPIIVNGFAEKSEIISTAAKVEHKKGANSIFSNDITYEWEYFEDEDVMPYGLLKPSNADSIEKIPMILWLHGNNTLSETDLKSTGIVPVLMGWSNTKSLQPICAYVLCPHVSQKNADQYWMADSIANNVKTLLDNFIEEYNVDTNNIVIMGVSGGTFGVQRYINVRISRIFFKSSNT